MTKTTEDWNIPPEEWNWMPSGRPYQGKIRYVPFVDARVVMKHLDRIFGWDGWQSHYAEIANGLICTLTVKTESGEWIEKSDGSNLTEIQATKGGISKALVRAAAHLGVGRNVYDCPEVLDRYTEKDGRNFKPFDLSDEELSRQAKKLIADGQPAVPVEQEEEVEKAERATPTSDWSEFLRLFRALSETSQNLIKEWYSNVSQDDEPPTSDIVGTSLFDKLMTRVREELDIPEEGPPI
jgi:hypothetical protein